MSNTNGSFDFLELRKSSHNLKLFSARLSVDACLWKAFVMGLIFQN
jgi:hypothetical protein